MNATCEKDGHKEEVVKTQEVFEEREREREGVVKGKSQPTVTTHEERVRI